MSAADPIADRTRAIRVFVSSTFRDMAAEREELVKRAFPRIRKLCEERGVTWGEVDLRWGITDEAKAEGKVLPICLAEIQRCKPYFIGLLGERYGWVPDELDPPLVAEQTWLARRPKRSITELEILHGVLNNPEMARHAFFYFRDPAFVQSLSDVERQQFLELPTLEEIDDHGPEEATRRAEDRCQKLVELKALIRESDFPVREYADPIVLGELVFDDFTELIDDLYPEGSQPEALDRETAQHEAFARSRAAVYVGRRSYFERIDAHVDGSEHPLVVIGESGVGKSALLANWALRWRESHPDDLVILHFVGGTADSTNWTAMLRHIIGEVDRRLGRGSEIPAGTDELRAAFVDRLHLALDRGRLVVVLDALNQLEDRDGAPDLVWLPSVLPPTVRLVCSTLRGRPLDEVMRRSWPRLEVAALDSDERRELIREYLGQYTKKLASEHVDRIVEAPQAANPLFLTAMLEELRLWGDHDTLRGRIGHYLEAPAIDDLYERILARYEQDYDRDRPALVRDVMSLLWAARRGLSEAELLDLLGSDEGPLPGAFWAPLHLAAEGALMERSSLISFSHEFLRRAVEDKYLSGEEGRRAAHLSLADYFANRKETQRGVDELPWQLAEGGGWRRLHDLLTDGDYLEKLWGTNEFDVRQYWTRLESGSEFGIRDAYESLLDEQSGSTTAHWIAAALLLETGHPTEAIALYERLFEHARDKRDYDGIATAAGNLALLFKGRGRLEDAMAYHKEEERICRHLDDDRGVGLSLNHQALILSDRGSPDEAAALLVEAEQVCRRVGEKRVLGVVLGNRAEILRKWGRFDEALTLADEAERIFKELGDRGNLQRLLGGRGSILMDCARYDEALRLFQEQERLCRELGNQADLARATEGQAAILQKWGRMEEAMALLQVQEAICRELGDRRGVQRSRGNQAAVLEGWGRFDEAMELFAEQERVDREIDDREGVGAALSGQALILARRGLHGQAMTLLEEYEQICRDLGNAEDLATCLGRQATILMTQGRLNEAMSLLEESERICREVGDTAGLQRAVGTRAQVLQDWGRLDDALALFEEQERICREIGDRRGLAVAIGNKAVLLREERRLDEALRLIEEQETICREIGHKPDLAIAVGNKALVLVDLGRPDSAIAAREEQERVCREIGDTEGLLHSFGHRAVILRREGRPGDALVVLAELEALSRELGDGDSLQDALGRKAECLVDLDRIEDALVPLAEKERICRELGLTEALGRTLEGKAMLLMKLGDSGGAMETQAQSADVHRQLGDHSALAESLLKRATLEATSGDARTAMETIHEARAVALAGGDTELVEGIDATSELIRRLLT